MAKQWEITIKPGGEYSAKDDDDIYNENVFFADVYQQAKHCLDEIVRSSKMRTDSENSYPGAQTGSSRYRAQTSDFLMGMPNNIIAFCAERGQGKTSAMLSFSHALKGLSADKLPEPAKAFWENTVVPKHHYEVLYNIDPTIMTDSDSILKIIISQMFENYRQLYESGNLSRLVSKNTYPYQSKSDPLYEDLMMDFQKCFHSVEVLMERGALSEKESLNDLEQIADLGDSSNLRGSLYQLIQHYLSAITSSSDSFLVIQIDDADTAISKAYRILEDVRKYLVLPRVVILFATNMVQLESVVEQHFLTEYHESLSHKESMVTVSRCHEIANLYLEKTLPNTHRIELPDLGKALQESYTQIRLRYQAPDSKVNLLDTAYSKWCEETGIPQAQELQREGQLNGKNKQQFYVTQWSYQEQLLHFLHQKTGLFFLVEKNRLHEFLPSSMRELTHFLAYFNALPSLDNEPYDDVIHCFSHSQKSTPCLQIWKANLKRLEHYLVDLWTNTNLSQSARTLFRSFREVPSGQMHSFLLKNLPEYYTECYILEHQRTAEARGFSTGNEAAIASIQKKFFEQCAKYGAYDSQNKSLSDSATYGIVNAALTALTELPDGARQQKLAYAIRLFYTIRFHLLLLDDLENAPSDTSRLTSFMADTPLIFSPDDVFDRNSLFWHLHIRKDDLELTWPGYSNKNLWTRYAGRFLRRELSDFTGRYTLPIGEKTWQFYTPSEFDTTAYVFNPLYYLMYELDQIALAPLTPDIDKNSTEQVPVSSGQRTEYQNNAVSRGQMRTALIILLNVDIQLCLSQNFRRQKDNAFSLDNAVAFYRREAFCSTLFSACDLNVIPSDQDYSNPSVRYGEIYNSPLILFHLEEPNIQPDASEILNLIQQSLLWKGRTTRDFYLDYYSKQYKNFGETIRDYQNLQDTDDPANTAASKIDNFDLKKLFDQYLPCAFDKRFEKYVKNINLDKKTVDGILALRKLLQYFDNVDSLKLELSSDKASNDPSNASADGKENGHTQVTLDTFQELIQQLLNVWEKLQTTLRSYFDVFNRAALKNEK